MFLHHIQTRHSSYQIQIFDMIESALMEPVFLPPLEGVIEDFSHRNHGTSRIVSTFVVGNCDDEAQTQREEHLYSRVDAASGALIPRPQSLTDSLVRSTPVRRFYVASRFDCFNWTSSLCSSIQSSTLYSMSFGSSVFRALYGATGTTPAVSRWSCQSSVS